MYLECPVIAMRSGGPMETVVDEITGFLCKPNDCQEYGNAILRVIEENIKSGGNMGEEGKKHVESKFSPAAMRESLHKHILYVCSDDINNRKRVKRYLNGLIWPILT